MIDAKRINEILKASFIDEDYTDETKVIPTIGVRGIVSLDPDKVMAFKEEIIDFLMQLDDKFREEVGGGYSFLAAPFDKNGEQWGEQINANELFILGQAIGRVKLLFPSFMWSLLPGGVPYYVITKEKQERNIMTVGDVKAGKFKD